MNRSSQLRGSLAFVFRHKSGFAGEDPPRQQSRAQRIAAVTLLLALTAIARPSVAVSSISPVLAQTAPTTAPTPATAEKTFPWLWLLLIPVAAGLRWSMVARRSSETVNTSPIADDLEPLASDPTGGLSSVPEQQQPPKARLVADLDRSTVERQEVTTPVGLDGKSEQIDAEAVDRDDLSEPTTGELVAALQLLEERLVVDIQRRKVGEVVVRKEIETRIVEVPIRREKLIVEQVSPEFKQLATIDLGQSAEPAPVATEAAYLPTVDAKFTSIVAAVDFLKEIADREDSALQHVHMNVVFKDRTPKFTD